MNNRTKTILIVDDSKDIIDVLVIILENEGYQVEHASNGLKAVDILRTKYIDLLVTDLLMPDMDGIELIDYIKTNHPDLSYILISGGGRQLEADANFSYLDSAKLLTGAKHILRKPFDAEELITVVNGLLS